MNPYAPTACIPRYSSTLMEDIGNAPLLHGSQSTDLEQLLGRKPVSVELFLKNVYGMEHY